MTVYSDDGLFEWDDEKNNINMIKHGISFEEIKQSYDDPYALIVEDEINSLKHKEKRYKVLGMLQDDLIILMAITYRNDRVRIISARFATKKEVKAYYENIR